MSSLFCFKGACKTISCSLLVLIGTTPLWYQITTFGFSLILSSLKNNSNHQRITLPKLKVKVDTKAVRHMGIRGFSRTWLQRGRLSIWLPGLQKAHWLMVGTPLCVFTHHTYCVHDVLLSCCKPAFTAITLTRGARDASTTHLISYHIRLIHTNFY